jgi:hypothetical protein
MRVLDNQYVESKLEEAVCDLIGFPQPRSNRVDLDLVIDDKLFECQGTDYAPPGSRRSCSEWMRPGDLRHMADQIEHERPWDATELLRWADRVEALSSAWNAYVDAVHQKPDDGGMWAAYDEGMSHEDARSLVPPDFYVKRDAWGRIRNDAWIALEDAVREIVGGSMPKYRTRERVTEGEAR